MDKQSRNDDGEARELKARSLVRIDPPKRGYNVVLQRHPSGPFRVVVQGTLREKAWYYAREREACRYYDRLTFTIRQAADLPLDGVPAIDLLAFRHYLYTLPRGACAGTYMSIFFHPLALWCSYLAGKNFWFDKEQYTSCRILEFDEYGFPKRVEATAVPRPLPIEVGIYLSRTYPGKKAIVTRDEAIQDLDLALCIAQDMQATARDLGAELMY